MEDEVRLHDYPIYLPDEIVHRPPKSPQSLGVAALDVSSDLSNVLNYGKSLPDDTYELPRDGLALVQGVPAPLEGILYVNCSTATGALLSYEQT